MCDIFDIIKLYICHIYIGKLIPAYNLLLFLKHHANKTHNFFAKNVTSRFNSVINFMLTKYFAFFRACKIKITIMRCAIFTR